MTRWLVTYQMPGGDELSEETEASSAIAAAWKVARSLCDGFGDGDGYCASPSWSTLVSVKPLPPEPVKLRPVPFGMMERSDGTIEPGTAVD